MVPRGGIYLYRGERLEVEQVNVRCDARAQHQLQRR